MLPLTTGVGYAFKVGVLLPYSARQEQTGKSNGDYRFHCRFLIKCIMRAAIFTSVAIQYWSIIVVFEERKCLDLC